MRSVAKPKQKDESNKSYLEGQICNITGEKKKKKFKYDYFFPQSNHFKKLKNFHKQEHNALMPPNVDCEYYIDMSELRWRTAHHARPRTAEIHQFLKNRF